MFDWQWIIFVIPAMLIAATFHEYAHAWAAARLGDYTAKSEGRLTLNPLAHIDWLGLLAMILVRVGWAKPVPINPYNFENPRRDEALTALAGPISNLIQAVVVFVLLKLWVELFKLLAAPELVFMVGEFVANFFLVLILVNLSLMVFNLFPFPPLDGYRIIKVVLPRKWSYYFQKIEEYSFILILLIVLPFSPLNWAITWLFTGVLTPIILFVQSLL